MLPQGGGYQVRARDEVPARDHDGVGRGAAGRGDGGGHWGAAVAGPRPTWTESHTELVNTY